MKKENSTCELALCVAGFSFLVLCVCCEREKKGAAACFALQVRYFACKESHGTFPSTTTHTTREERSRAKPANPLKNRVWTLLI